MRRNVRPPVDVIEERLGQVRADYLGCMPERDICRKRASEWVVKRRQIRRYIAVVKERLRRDRSQDAPDAVAADRAVAEAQVISCIADAVDIQRRAKDEGDFKSELGAVKLRMEGAVRWHDMRGLKAPIKIEHTSADPVSKMTADERRERALRALKRRSAQLVPMAATGEGETH